MCGGVCMSGKVWECEVCVSGKVWECEVCMSGKVWECAVCVSAVCFAEFSVCICRINLPRGVN